MLSTSIRCSYAFRRSLVWCALIVAASPVTGCERAVQGSVDAAASASHATPGPPKTLAQLLVEPARFPPRYLATVLTPPDVAQAVAEIDGVAPGAVVDPPLCAPVPPGPSPVDAVAVRGLEEDTSNSLTVTLVRMPAPLAQRRDQILSCSSFTATAGDQVATVTVAILPAPPVDADDTVAVDQKVDGADGRVSHLTVLIGQIADVRITAAMATGEDDGTVDTGPLDSVFTDAVLAVRRDARR